MSKVLFLLNAIALAVLLGFHFAPESDTAPVAQRVPHYLQMQKAPQWAVVSDQRGVVSQEVSEENLSLKAPSSERLVF